MKTRKIITVIILTILSLNGIAGVGDNAIDFTVTTLDDGSYTLSNDYGKVILIFFFGYSCPYCITHGPIIQNDIIEVFSSDTNFAAVGVDVWNGSSSQVEAFKTSTGLTIPLGLMASSIGSSYGANQDVLVVIDSEQKIIFQSQSYSEASAAAKAKIEEALAALNSTSVNLPEEQTFTLKQNFPNPFNSITTIQYVIQSPTKVKLSILDNTGKTVSVLVDEYRHEGEHEVVLDINELELSKGIYFYKLETEEKSISLKMIKI